MPFEAYAELAEAPVKLPPAGTNGAPRRSFFTREGYSFGRSGLSFGHFQDGNIR